jgi:hypothetical protein
MRGNAARALLPALAVLALVGVVAVAATGSTPAGSGDTREPADVLLDTVFSFMLVALIPALVLLVYGLMQRKEIAKEMASGRYPRGGLLTFLAFLALFGVVAYFRLRGRDWGLLGSDNPGEAPLIGGQAPTGTPSAGPTDLVYEPEFAWLPVLVVLTLVAAGLVAWLLARRRKRPTPDTGEAVAESLADVLEDTLDDLRAEADPRRAVIAAYARLEKALAASGLPRRPAETSEEYVTRILGDLEVSPRSVRKLKDLYTRAKFSQHDVGTRMANEAIDALERVRDELQAAAVRRDEETRERARALSGAERVAS